MKEISPRFEEESRLAKMDALVGASFDSLNKDEMAELSEKDQRQSFGFITKRCW